MMALVESFTRVSCLHKQTSFIPLLVGLYSRHFRFCTIQAYIKAYISRSQIPQIYSFQYHSVYQVISTRYYQAVQQFRILTPYHRLHQGLPHPCQVISYYSIFDALPQAALKVTTPTYKVISYYQNYALNSIFFTH